MLPGKVNASNALVVTGDTGATTGAVGALGTRLGTVDSSNRLKVVFA